MPVEPEKNMAELSNLSLRLKMGSAVGRQTFVAPEIPTDQQQAAAFADSSSPVAFDSRKPLGPHTLRYRSAFAIKVLWLVVVVVV